MRRAAWFLALMALAAPGEAAARPQDGPAAGEDVRILTADHAERRGRITGFDSSGCLEILDPESGRKARLIVEEVRKIRFGKDAPLPFDPKAERVRLLDGGTLSGRLRSFEEGVATMEAPAGTFRIPRGAIRSISLAPVLGAPPEIKDGKKDVLLREAAKAAGGDGKPECSASYGDLRSITAEGVAFLEAKEEVIERASARMICFRHDPPAGEPPPGWFAKVVFRNGDRLAGVLRSAGKGRMGIFSPLVGEAEI